MRERGLSEVARAIERYESGDMDRDEAARFYQLLVETGARLADANASSAIIRQTVRRPERPATPLADIDDDLPSAESISLTMLEAHPAAVNNPAGHALRDHLEKIYREHVQRMRQRYQEALARQEAVQREIVEQYEQRLREAADAVADKTRELEAEQSRNREEIGQLRRQYATLLEGKNRQLAEVETHYRRQAADLQGALTAHDTRLTEMEASHREELDRLRQQHDVLLQARESRLQEVESRYQRQMAARDEQLAQRDRLLQEQETSVAARLAEMEERCRYQLEASSRTLEELEQRVKKAEDWARILEHDRRHEVAKQEREDSKGWWRRNR